MVNPVGNALSGLRAAGRRLEVSANNIANQQSTRTSVNGKVTNTPYQPQRVDQVSLSTGGVRVVTSNVTPATRPLFDPSHPDANAEGVVNLPNVDIATELVNQKIATYDFQANLNTLKVQDELEESLLDILS